MFLSKTYLSQLERKLGSWKLTRDLKVMNRKLLAEVDAGYIRIRVRLKNGDLFEISEYVSGGLEVIDRKSYSYHWQTEEGQLIKRWDNAAHHPHVATHPFHVHAGSEPNVLASEVMTVFEVMEIIEKELMQKRPQQRRAASAKTIKKTAKSKKSHGKNPHGSD